MVTNRPRRSRVRTPRGAAARRRAPASLSIERVQTGVRMEKRLLKVLKAFAELKDLSLGDLLEGIVLHAFEGKAPFSPESQRQVADLKRIYGLDLGASARTEIGRASCRERV